MIIIQYFYNRTIYFFLKKNDVIKKNITEEQIMNAVLTLYENGWSRVKFYFICGLPTETLEDMDEMAELFRRIRYRSKLLKKEKGTGFVLYI